MENTATVQYQNADLNKVLKRLSEVESALNLMKKLYEEKEQLTAQLQGIIGLNQEVSEGDYIFSIVDNFANNNVVFRPAAVRRFDLKIDSHFARKTKEDKANAKKASK